MTNSKTFLFPDRYLLKGILGLVAINLMVPGIFGVDPPRWFDSGVLEQTRLEGLTAKGERPFEVTAQSRTISVLDTDGQKQKNVKNQTDMNSAWPLTQLVEPTALVEQSPAELQSETAGLAFATRLAVKMNKEGSAEKFEQPAVKASESQNEVQLASNSPKIVRTKKSKVRRPLLVARVIAKRIPTYHLDLPTPEQKENFIQIILPLVLAANEEISMRRAAVKRAANAGDQAALRKWAHLYRIDVEKQSTQDLKQLILMRADEIPVALALAQAAVESGWGTSRFALQGNALFGQWAWKESAGLKPLQASNERAVVRSFPNLFGSVRAYMHNLNTHQSYEGLRRERARLLGRDERGKGYALAANLDRYAEIGMEYVDKLRTIIRTNDLDQYATAKLQ